MVPQRNLARVALLLAALIVLYFVLQIFKPFLGSIAVALVLTTLSYPVFELISAKLKGRRGWAALATCVILTLVIVVPFVLLFVMLANEVGQVYGQLQEALAKGGGLKSLQRIDEIPMIQKPLAWLASVVDLKRIDVAGNLASLLQKVSVFLLTHSTAIVSGVFSVLFNFFIMVVTMFFLFRDGYALRQELGQLSPVSERYTTLLSKTFREVARATVLGSLVTAAVQGLAAGIIYWALGVSNALFWGTLSAFFSLVPIVGSALVWGPWAIYFLLSGSVVKGILLIALQALVVGSLDNILRPWLIRGRIRMHSMIIFFSVMGGIAYFGVLGMVFGPIVVAIGLTLLEAYKAEFRESPLVVTSGGQEQG
jgi:predicted PurR-regulated permease PerM